MSRPRRPRLDAAASAVAMAVAVLMLASCDRTAPDAAVRSTVSAGPRAGTFAPAPAPAQNGATPADSWKDAREQAVTTILMRRMAAVDRGDQAAWMAPLGSHPDPQLRAVQRRIFDRMVAMRASNLRAVALREKVAPIPAPAGTRATWDVEANLSYELEGFDTAPRSFDLDLTFTADPARPGSATITASAPAQRPQPWDLDGLVVRRTPQALVLAVGPSSRVAEILRRAHTAAARVAQVWGSSQPAVWISPATDADAARLLGRSTAGLNGVAAATDGPLTPGQKAGADRIVLVPGAWSSLRPDGRDVVMTHELTHATVRAATTQAVPLWLAEGFADFVAYRPLDVPERTIVAPALRQVRGSGVPTALPGDAEFDPAANRIETAYALALLAVRTLADEHGTTALVRFYAAAAGGIPMPSTLVGDHEAAVDLALQRVLHTDRAAVVRAWQARIRGLLS